MRIHWVQERISLKASRRPGGVEFCLAAVAVDDIVADVAGVSRVGNPKLRVIEDIEGLGSKLDVEVLGIWLEMFVERHVEVDPPGISKVVAARVPEGQAAWRGKSSRIKKQRPYIVSAGRDKRLAAVRRANDVGVGADAETVAHSGVVSGARAVSTPSIDDAERCAGIDGSDSAPLPAAEQRFRQGAEIRSRCRDSRRGVVVRIVAAPHQVREAVEQPQEGQVVNIAEVEYVFLVEIGAGMAGMDVERVGEIGTGAVGGVIQRVTVRVSQTNRKRPSGLAQRSLQGVVLGVGDILHRDDVAEA